MKHYKTRIPFSNVTSSLAADLAAVGCADIVLGAETGLNPSTAGARARKGGIRRAAARRAETPEMQAVVALVRANALTSPNRQRIAVKERDLHHRQILAEEAKKREEKKKEEAKKERKFRKKN